MEKNRLGEKLRSVRESRSLSQEQLAERGGLPVEQIAQIESGSLIPSLSPLMKISRALGVRLGTLLDDVEDVGPVVTRAGNEDTVMRFSGRERPSRSDLDFFSLALNKAGRHMEPFLVDIHPGSAKEEKLSAHEGEEFLHVVSGEIEIAYGKERIALKAGDSIYYDSIVPHHVHSAGGSEARILAVVYAP
jgi:transcriptional regulator with XRE-family HTH domain